MDEERLQDKIDLHLEELLKKVDEKKRIWMKDAIGIVTLSEGGRIVIESGIIADIRDWQEVYTRQTSEETEKEFKHKENWQKWKKIAPALVADLERSETIAKDMAKNYDANLRMVVERAIAQFIVEINGRDLDEDQLLRRVYKHVDAMFEAWDRFLTWLHSKERLKIVRKKAR